MSLRVSVGIAAGMGVACLAVSNALAAAPEKAPDAAPVEIKAERVKAMTPKVVRHADGSYSADLRHAPAHGLVAQVGADGRVRILCVDNAHEAMEKSAHQRLHDEQAGMAWE